MTNQNITEKLSTVDYWNEVLESAQLPRVNSRSSYLYTVTMDFIHDTISNPAYKTFFEVGCGSSGWLPYFAQKYNLKVSGLDYSDVGCKLARKNLELLNIKYENIFCKDFFEADPTEGNKYDIIFSYGVVEHFSEPKKIIERFKTFAYNNGIIITLVPNFSGLIGRLTKIFIPDVYKIHNIITKEQLKSYHAENEMKIIKSNYAGIFAFNVMPWEKSNHWLFRKGTFRRKISFFFLKATDKVMSTVFKILPFDIPSRFFSPYVICIARTD